MLLEWERRERGECESGEEVFTSDDASETARVGDAALLVDAKGRRVVGPVESDLSVSSSPAGQSNPPAEERVNMQHFDPGVSALLP